MSGDLLAEATTLSAQLYGPDPVEESAAGIADLEMNDPAQADLDRRADLELVIDLVTRVIDSTPVSTA